jgi:flagellum-specific ATP synthase
MIKHLAPKIDRYFQRLKTIDPIKTNGKLIQVLGLVMESVGPPSSIGELCHLRSKRTGSVIRAEVVGFRDNRVLLMPLGENEGVAPGDEVIAQNTTFSTTVGDDLIGRVINGYGEPIDGKGPLNLVERRSIYNEPPDPMSKKRVTEPLATGIRAIDGLITCGKGQRTGIFAGSGVGKSTLLGMIARNTSADINVIATTIAEYFRNKGLDVMLMMDSVTRVAMAQREIGLAIGEPPTTKGYTPSVFSL